jgi:hypothetical protein
VSRAFPVSFVASDTSIKAALEPVKLSECIDKGGGDLSSTLAI